MICARKIKLMWHLHEPLERLIIVDALMCLPSYPKHNTCAFCRNVVCYTVPEGFGDLRGVVGTPRRLMREPDRGSEFGDATPRGNQTPTPPHPTPPHPPTVKND